MKKYILIILSVMLTSLNLSAQNTDNMLVRISEIEVHPEYLDEYLQYAYTVGATSVREEQGVVCIYPMQTRRDDCQIRILEIYASAEAYQHHIKTAHFQKYKTETLHMVKSLDLVDMNALDPATMPQIFKKMPQVKDKITIQKMDRIELCKQNYTALFGGEALNGQGTDPEMMDILQKYIFGEVFQTGNLDMKTRELITCVTLATMQQLPQLTAHAGAALNVGVTPIELREAIYQCASNIGFPKTLNALGAILLRNHDDGHRGATALTFRRKPKNWQQPRNNYRCRHSVYAIHRFSNRFQGIKNNQRLRHRTQITV